jgi:hypothetical protein
LSLVDPRVCFGASSRVSIEIDLKGTAGLGTKFAKS